MVNRDLVHRSIGSFVPARWWTSARWDKSLELKKKQNEPKKPRKRMSRLQPYSTTKCTSTYFSHTLFRTHSPKYRAKRIDLRFCKSKMREPFEEAQKLTGEKNLKIICMTLYIKEFKIFSFKFFPILLTASPWYDFIAKSCIHDSLCPILPALLLFTYCGRTLLAQDARNSHASSRI